MAKIDKVDGTLYLPLPRDPETRKWSDLRERLRRKKEKYLEGVKIYKTTQEAMIYAGIKSRQSLVQYRNADPEFAMREILAFEEAEEEMVELAIKGLYVQLQKGDMRAIRYMLDRRSVKFKPKQENDNNLNLPDGAKEITVVFKDYSNGDSTKQNIPTVVPNESED